MTDKDLTTLLPTDWEGRAVDRPLVDDLADVLACTVSGWEHVIGHDLARAPEVQRVLARYRAERLGALAKLDQPSKETP